METIQRASEMKAARCVVSLILYFSGSVIAMNLSTVSAAKLSSDAVVEMKDPTRLA